MANRGRQIWIVKKDGRHQTASECTKLHMVKSDA